MANSVPEFPVFESDAEKTVWKFLKDELPRNATVIYGAKIHYQGLPLEADFIVVWPGHGVVFIEVKGGHIRLKGDQWSTTNRKGQKKLIEPDEQARRVGFAFKNLYQEQFEGTLFFGWLVIFPETDLPPHTYTNECPAKHILDKATLPQLKNAIQSVASEANAVRSASRDECEQFISLVTQASLEEDFIESARARAYAVNQATLDQSDVLRIARALPTFVVEGPAGTGKTTMALQKAYELANEGKKVALLCYSKGLAKFLQQRVSAWPGLPRPTFTGTFHQLLTLWDITSPEVPDDKWWSEGAPNAMIEKLGRRQNLEKFDAIVIDEGQDFRDLWWDVINASLTTNYSDSKGNANLYIFGDSQQSIFGLSRYKELPYPRLTLDVNVRNTELISEALDEITEISMQSIGPIGPPIQHKAVQPEDVMSEAESIVQDLIDAGWLPGDIAFLTTSSRHVEFHKDYIKQYGIDAYWDRYFNDEEVFYSTVQLFKGLERPVVVLAVNGWREDQRIEEYFYVGMSRARDQLIIVGEIPSTIEEKIKRFVEPLE